MFDNFNCVQLNMIGGLIGSALGAAGTIWGAKKASEAMKKVRNDIKAQRSENESWYNRRYNEDATQRADAQRVLSQTEEAIKNRNREAAGTSAVMGGTEESVAATKAANAQAMADAAARIAVAGEARKDAIEEDYRNRDGSLRSQLNGMEVAKANSIGQAVQGVVHAAGTLGSGIDDYLEER